MSATTPMKVVLVGVGGATCSGKTTLAKHLHRILLDSVIIHQDDFTPPEEHIPIHPVHGVQDWDTASGAIEWSRMLATLRHIKSTGTLPRNHSSHDHLNQNCLVSISMALEERWRDEFRCMETDSVCSSEGRRAKVRYVLVDGFLMYWHPEIVELLDVCIFLRVPLSVLRKRRQDRFGYTTAEGSLWRDPPHYWEGIVWPAYVDAHKHMFLGEDVEQGFLSKNFAGHQRLLIEGIDESMDRMVDESCTWLRECCLGVTTNIYRQNRQ